MTNIKKTLAAGALAVAMAAGSANAGSVIQWNGVKGSKIVAFDSSIGLAKLAGGTFAAWTVYRFFQNCGPFRCN